MLNCFHGACCLLAILIGETDYTASYISYVFKSVNAIYSTEFLLIIGDRETHRSDHCFTDLSGHTNTKLIKGKSITCQSKTAMFVPAPSIKRSKVVLNTKYLT